MKPAPQPNFDLVARSYRLLERLTFGRALEHCRNCLLPELTDCRSALVYGDGDGRFLAALLAANSRIAADAVDSSRAMLELLQRRAMSAAPNAVGRLRTYHIDAHLFLPERQYDLVVTHFFLDCLAQPELDSLVARIAPHLAPGALWLVSDFHIPSGPIRLPARLLVRSLYFGFRVLTGLRTSTLPNHAAALHAHGFKCIAHRASLGGILISEIWQFCDSVSADEGYTSRMTDQKHHQHPADPVPDPEPASPSLSGPDRGVFGHDTKKGEKTEPGSGTFKPRDDWEPGGPPGGKSTGGGGGNNTGGSNTGSN